MRFFFSARTSAFSSMTAPRAVLIMKAVVFISANWRVRNHVARLGIERRMKRHEIGLRQEPLQRDMLHAELALRLGFAARPPIDDFHAKAARATRRGLCRCAPPRRCLWSCRAHRRRARWFDCEPGNLPARTSRSPSTMRRATASISPKWMSAVASATTGGTTVTGMPRLVASATSMLSGVIDIEQTARSFGLAASTARSMRSCSRREQDIALLDRCDQLATLR